MSAKIIRQIAHGELEMVARNVMQQQTMKEAILKQVERDIQAECTPLCSKKNPSILSKVSSDNLMQLTDTAIVNPICTGGAHNERTPINIYPSFLNK